MADESVVDDLPAGVSIRNYSKSDANALAEFTCVDIGSERKWTNPPQKVIREFPDAFEEQGTAADAMVATDLDGKLVGATVYDYQEENGEEVAVVLSLGVIHECRRQGIGFALKRAVMARVGKERPGVPLTSTVHRANFKMNRLNDKLGIKSEPDPLDAEYLLTTTRVAVVKANINVKVTVRAAATVVARSSEGTD